MRFSFDKKTVSLISKSGANDSMGSPSTTFASCGVSARKEKSGSSMFGKSYSLARKSGAGFTLIEMVIYISILAIISVLAINSTFGMLRAFSDMRVTRDINNTATVLLERMTREIRNANAIDAQSVIGSNPGKLVLNTKDDFGADTTMEFSISSSILRLKEGAVDLGALHPRSVAIDNLVFYSLTSSASVAVRVELQLTGTRGNIQKTKKFYTTVVLRDSY